MLKLRLRLLPLLERVLLRLEIEDRGGRVGVLSVAALAEAVGDPYS